MPILRLLVGLLPCVLHLLDQFSEERRFVRVLKQLLPSLQELLIDIPLAVHGSDDLGEGEGGVGDVLESGEPPYFCREEQKG